MTAVAQKILTDRINRIEVSATMAITAEALKMKASGIDMANFGAGEPHFATPRHIKDAAIDAIENNFTRYTDVAGVPEVRKAVVERHAADFGTDYTVEECVFTTGGKLALFNAVEVLVEHGDEVIVPVPLLGHLQGHHPVRRRQSSGLRRDRTRRTTSALPRQMIEAAITPKTKAIILNFAVEPVGCGRLAGGSGGHCSPGAHARHLCAAGRVLRLPRRSTGASVTGGSFTDCKEHVVSLGRSRRPTR